MSTQVKQLGKLGEWARVSLELLLELLDGELVLLQARARELPRGRAARRLAARLARLARLLRGYTGPKLILPKTCIFPHMYL